jgi:hypothetical protein
MCCSVLRLNLMALWLSKDMNVCDILEDIKFSCRLHTVIFKYVQF